MDAPKDKYVLSFAKWLDVSKTYSFWKGRIALYAILKALGIGFEDEVILPGYACVMDVNPIKYLGTRPVYYEQLFIIIYIFQPH